MILSAIPKTLRIWVIVISFALLSAAAMQDPSAKQTGPDEQKGWPDPLLPKVSFVFDHAEITPSHFEIVVDSLGKGSYSSRSDPGGDSSRTASLSTEAAKGEDLGVTFTLSSSTNDRIFALAKSTNYFDGNFDYTKSKIAFTGKKTLSYIDSKHATSATFNWSENAAIEELGTIFLGISSTLETGARLQHLIHHDKLGLNAELSKLEQSTQNRQMREIYLIADVLQRIASDSSVMMVARRRAERLLQHSGGGRP